jgi:hypothetical protein
VPDWAVLPGWQLHSVNAPNEEVANQNSHCNLREKIWLVVMQNSIQFRNYFSEFVDTHLVSKMVLVGSIAQVRIDMNRAHSDDCFFGCDAFSITHRYNALSATAPHGAAQVMR